MRQRSKPSPDHAVVAAEPKKAANVSVDAELLRQARELDINLSQALEERLVELIRTETRRRWLAENEGAIADYNERVDRLGVYSDGVRRF